MGKKSTIEERKNKDKQIVESLTDTEKELLDFYYYVSTNLNYVANIETIDEKRMEIVKKMRSMMENIRENNKDKIDAYYCYEKCGSCYILR